MPRSIRNRSVDIPLALYERLKTQADEERTTIPAVLQGIVANSDTMHEYWAELSSQVALLALEVRRLATLVDAQTKEG